MCFSIAILIKDISFKEYSRVFAVAAFRHKHSDKRQHGIILRQSSWNQKECSTRWQSLCL